MYNRYLKRCVDVVGGGVALSLLALPLLAVALWVKLDSHGPVIFRQPRYGKDKKPFTVYKFRTMSIDAPKNVATNDFNDSHSYITRSGKIMRKLSIDELPQLFNVLKGDMSLVGPRPVVLSEKRLIKLRDQYDANVLKPGVTGWAQVNGRDELDDAAKAELDGYYAERVSLYMDIKVALKTVWVIVFAHGHAEGHEQGIKSDNSKIAVGE